MYGMMAILAQEMVSSGKQFDEIVSSVNRMIENAVTLFSVDTLDYLCQKRQNRPGTALSWYTP